MEDPLRGTTESTITKNFLTQLNNTRGRPISSKVIKFSPQPKSIISELLAKSNQSLIDATEQPVAKSLIFKIKDSNEEINNSISCSHRYKNEIDFKKHIIAHKQYSCQYPQCSYTTKLSSNLVKHKRKHTTEKPFLCDQCTFRTNFVNSLTVHRRIHTADRPYVCKYCSYKCNSSSNLKKHCQHRHFKNSS